MICANRALYRREGDQRHGLDAFTSGQGRDGCSLSSCSGGDFLGHHAPAFRVSRSTAGGNSGQAQCNDTLSVKAEAPRIGQSFKEASIFPHRQVAKQSATQQVMFWSRVLKEQSNA
jgi:hypothetical protein